MNSDEEIIKKSGNTFYKININNKYIDKNNNYSKKFIFKYDTNTVNKNLKKDSKLYNKYIIFQKLKKNNYFISFLDNFFIIFIIVSIGFVIFNSITNNNYNNKFVLENTEYDFSYSNDCKQYNFQLKLNLELCSNREISYYSLFLKFKNKWLKNTIFIIIAINIYFLIIDLTYLYIKRKFFRKWKNLFIITILLIIIFHISSIIFLIFNFFKTLILINWILFFIIYSLIYKNKYKIHFLNLFKKQLKFILFNVIYAIFISDALYFNIFFSYIILVYTNFFLLLFYFGFIIISIIGITKNRFELIKFEKVINLFNVLGYFFSIISIFLFIILNSIRYRLIVIIIFSISASFFLLFLILNIIFYTIGRKKFNKYLRKDKLIKKLIQKKRKFKFDIFLYYKKVGNEYYIKDWEFNNINTLKINDNKFLEVEPDNITRKDSNQYLLNVKPSERKIQISSRALENRIEFTELNSNRLLKVEDNKKNNFENLIKTIEIKENIYGNKQIKKNEDNKDDENKDVSNKDLDNRKDDNKNEKKEEQKNKKLLKREKECYICLTNKANVIIDPCNHGKICDSCLIINWTKKGNCNLCNKDIKMALIYDEIGTTNKIKYFYIKLD